MSKPGQRLARVTAVFSTLVLLFYAFAVSKHFPKRPVLLSVDEHGLISPETYEYVLNQPRVCNNESDILVVFLVPVAPHHYAHREAVRQTWGAPGSDTLTLFFLGLPEESPQKSEVQGKIETESRKYGDIIQNNFIDTYHNLTIKTLLMMRWLDAHCPGTRYGMKVDADIFPSELLAAWEDFKRGYAKC
uniref:Hexosyltransferase n=1 Tax=Neogobius melanostomus TaxID=47308 RepID=A0A8C6SU08_9GOBI